MTDKRNQAIYQFNVAIQEIRPLIWRRIQVSSVMTLPRLHRTLQIVMGWEDYHVHEFRINGKAFAEPDPEDHHFGRKVADERRVQLKTLLTAAGSSFEYIYDFGDNWRHDILLEAIFPTIPRKRYPVCLGGARSTPPEDVGGVGGYERYLEAFPSPSPHRQSPSTSLSKPAPVDTTFVEEFDRIVRSVIHSGGLPRKERIRLGPQDRIPLPLSARDRELILRIQFC